MNSKPVSGLYIKHRDRPVRRSTRTPREEATHKLSTPDSEGGNKSDVESEHSPEVTVQNFGEGTISPSSEPQWPGNDFEQTYEKKVINTRSSELKPSTNTLPSRAKKYVVENPGDSLRGLMRNKYITVPDSKRAKADQTDSQNLEASASVRVYDGATKSVQDYPSTSALNQPTPRLTSTYRGYPLNYTPNASQRQYKIKGRASHVATLRGYSTKISGKPKMATIKALPRDGTVRTVKGYNLSRNTMVRLSTSRDSGKQLSYDGPDGSLSFRRSTTYEERKEYNFSKFVIELDRPEHEAYTPGEIMSGRIILEVNRRVEIRFIELLIVGLCSVHFAKNEPNAAKHAQEVVISKRSYIMGTPDGRYNSVIMAGQYVSKFKFMLPKGLPSTLKYESGDHDFSFQVGYMVKARVCDELGSSSTRSTHSVNQFVKVLLSRRHQFHVRRPFDIHSVPNAMKSVTHSEFVSLNCIPFLSDPATITLVLDRSVFLAGDEIHVRLHTSTDTAKKIKHLTCELRQRISSTIKPNATDSILQVDVHDPNGSHHCNSTRDFTLYEFILPTHVQFIPTFLYGTKLLRVNYAILMMVKFKSCTSSVTLEVPVGIGPSASPINLEQTNSVPVFIRPKRFPYFSDDSKQLGLYQNGMAHGLQNGRAGYQSPKSPRSAFDCCSGNED